MNGVSPIDESSEVSPGSQGANGTQGGSAQKHGTGSLGPASYQNIRTPDEPSQGFRRPGSAWLFSMVFHALLLLAFSAWLTLPRSIIGPELQITLTDPGPLGEQLPSTEQWEIERLPDMATEQSSAPMLIETPVPDVPVIAPDSVPLPPAGPAFSETITSSTPAQLVSGAGFEGRSTKLKNTLLQSGGGSRQSELAVERGLRWLAAHQLADGSWHFNHNDSACHGLCRNPGTIATTTGATALALLPFLGAGHTHKQGEYQEVVQKGLYYLSSQLIVTSRGGDLHQGTMYAQGLATIVFCEAYAMSGDEDLRPYAQLALDFIVSAQHPAGGWRYSPGQPGDTTVTGWQLMALKSGQLAGLFTPSPTVYGVSRFLDSVQKDSGATYGYMEPDRNATNTAIGLLCRMYLGWPKSRPALGRGVLLLSELGPSENNMYYNYYATMVMHHYGGSLWREWNDQLRDYLITTQATSGHEAGSWFFDEHHTRGAGRLFSTAASVMILEVYYRYMPLYKEGVLEKVF